MAGVRVLYAVGMLTLWRWPSSIPLAELPDSLHFAPLGPFALLPGWPPVSILWTLEAVAVVALLAVLIGYRTRTASIAVTVLAVTLAGIRFSTGKIDHDLLVYLLPALLAGAWGARLAVRPEPYRRPRGDWLAVLLAGTFLTAGLAKVLTGWLDIGSPAVAGWMLTYLDVYSIETAAAEWATEHLSAVGWEAMDWVTVSVELGLAVLLLRRRTVPVAVAIAAAFNIGVSLLFGIDFSQLAPVYLAMLPISLRVLPERTPWGVACLMAAVTILASTMQLPRDPFGLLLLAAVGVSAVAALPLGGWQVPLRLQAVAAVLVLVPFVATMTVSEPYPAIIGPAFRGTGLGAVQVWTVDGHEATAEDVFGVPPPYSTNLGLFVWPSPYRQGHEFRRLWYHPHGRLPSEINVQWEPVY